MDFRRATLQLRPAGSLSWRLLCPALLSDHNVAVDRSVSERHWAFLWRLRATGNAITPSPRDGGSYRVALQQYKSFWQDSTLDLCQAGRRRSFARQGLSDEASRSLVLVGVCGDDSALWGYGRKPPLTHILPHYHVTWRIPAAAPLGDAFDLAHPPLPVLRTGAARRLLKALCPFWEGCLLLSAEGHR